jgi:hypothetical protein
MKPKIAAILVIGLLTLSIVGTGIAAVSQAVTEQPSSSSVALGGYTNQIGETDEGHSGVKGAFFRVCPFH